MSWCRIAACMSLFLPAGCAWEGPTLLAQATPSPPAKPPLVQLQRPRESSSQPTAPAVSKVPTANNPAPPPGQIAIRMCAEVNDSPILEDEVRQTMQAMLPALHALPEPERSARIKEVRRQVLDKLIERELILGDAMGRLKKNQQALDKLKEAANKEFEKQIRGWKTAINKTNPSLAIESDDDLKPYLESQGWTLEFLKRRSEREFMAHEYMMHRVYPQIDKIGHKEVRQYYEEHPGEFQAEDRVKWLHIFIGNTNAAHPDPASARRFAEEIVGRLKAGEDFIKLAEQYDEGTSKFTHGEGTGQRRGEIRPFEVENYLFGMSEGDIGPIVEIPSGCHIIKLVSREYAGLMPFDESTQLTVKRKLQGIVMQRESHRFLEQLKNKAVIRYFDANP